MKNLANLPKGETNGLSAIAGELADEGMARKPRRLRAALAVFDSRRVTVDADTHDEIVTVRFLRIETLLPEDLGAAEKLLRRALEARSGQTTLPLELQDELDDLFAQMADPDSAVDPDEPIDLVPGGDEDQAPDDDSTDDEEGEDQDNRPWPGDEDD